MGSESEEDKKCNIGDVVLPEEVRLTYFPKTSTKFSYDVLPLFELSEYRMKLANEVSILKNPENAKKWEEFVRGLPNTLHPPKVTLGSKKVSIFANYRKQKASPEYLASLIGPSSPEAIFRREK